MQKVEQSTGASITQVRVALDKKQRLRLPIEETQRLRAELGRLEARFALACEEKEMLHQQANASHQALQQIRHEAHLFRDKMLVDAKTLCQYHVDKRERSKLHAGNNEHRERLEQEAVASQKEMSKTTEQSVQKKLELEITKIQDEMKEVIDEAAVSRDQLKAVRARSAVCKSSMGGRACCQD
eukprot:5070844-Amphidinium_carterae.1